jgi:hypothetical protein
MAVSVNNSSFQAKKADLDMSRQQSKIESGNRVV